MAADCCEGCGREGEAPRFSVQVSGTMVTVRTGPSEPTYPHPDLYYWMTKHRRTKYRRTQLEIKH